MSAISEVMMNARLGRFLPQSVLLLCLAGLAAAASAQDPRQSVYFTGPGNEISRVVDFTTGTAVPAVIDVGTNLKGLVVRDDGAAGIRLIVANSTQSGGLNVYRGDGTRLGQIAVLSSAAGVALDTSGNLFAVNDDPGGADQLVMIPRKPACDGTAPPAGCHPGGYDDAITLDGQVDGADLLADVRFVQSAGQGATYQAGDVLVLVERPALLLRYAREDIDTKRTNPLAPDPTPATVLASASFAGTDPMGLAFAPNGELLVTTQQGRILRFGPGGAALPDFVASLGGSGVSLAVGLQDGTAEVFATVHEGGRVRRYKFNPDGTGAPDGSVTANAPYGVGNASLSDAVFTPVSDSPVTILPNTVQELTFEKVTKAGVTSGRVFVFEDPAPGQDRFLSDVSGLLAQTGLQDRKIPSHITALPLGPSQTPTFVLVVVSSGAQSIGATQEHHIEEETLGFTNLCTDPYDRQPRTFYATDPDDPAIIEGDSFTDISSGCGSNIGRGGQTSAILTAADNRFPTDIASEKLTALQDLVSSKATGGLSRYVSAGARSKLNGFLRSAVKALRSNPPSAVDPLESFISFVKCNPGSFDDSARNVSGELVARARSAQFMACGATVPGCNRKLPDPAPSCN
jgi:hypothetical protein